MPRGTFAVMDYTATSGVLWLTVATSILILRPFMPGRIKTVETLNKDYHYIIVGGGTAGCVLAGRLSEGPNVTVLLLEAGDVETDVAGTHVPLYGMSHINSSADWGEYSTQQEGACLSMKAKRCYLPRGKVLGGGSAINCMVWTRGHPQDYDQWSAAGCTGWDYSNVSRYFRRAERSQYDPALVGISGPVDISSHAETPLAETFLDAAKEAGHTLSEKPLESGGFQHVLSSSAKGARVSTVSAYLWSATHRENLHIATEALVTKIIIENKRAVGVEVEIKGKTHSVRATREVLLSAGTMGSAKLLLLSGIGPKDHLRETGIKVEADLPVGNNVQNHVTTDALEFLINSTDAITTEKLNTFLEKAKYNLLGTGLRSLPCGFDGVGYSKATAEPDDVPPSLQYFIMAQTLGHDPSTIPTIKKAFNYNDEVFDKLHGDMVGSHGFLILPILLHPKSRGYLRLRNKNPTDPPRYYANYLQHPYDINTLIQGIRIGYNLTQTKAFRSIVIEDTNKTHPACEELTIGSDAYFECFIRHNTLPLWNMVGSCKMGSPTDRSAVVDPTLKVRGIEGLRVVDASIMPSLITGGTNGAVVMIAEKAVDFIRAEFYNNYAFLSTL